MSIRIYTYPHNPYVAKAKIAAQYGGVTNIEEENNIKMGETNKTEEFLGWNPLGKVPTAVLPDGNSLFESNAIARYVARIGSDSQGLLGSSALEQSQIDQWIDVVSYYIAPTIFTTFAFSFGYMPYDDQKFKSTLEGVGKVFDGLERHLNKTGNQFIVNDRVTLADIILGCTLYNPLKISLDAKWRSTWPKTEAYLNRLLSQQQFVAVLGETKFVETFTAPSN
jgi:elongation factor 1-gamma